jgi:hypothetical protein
MYVNTENKEHLKDTNLTLHIDDIEELTYQIKQFSNNSFYIGIIQNENELIIEITEGKLTFPRNNDLAKVLDLKI